MLPDPNACCPDAYYCPDDAGTGGETECPRHGGFDVCCAHPERHIPMDIEAWHAAQQILEHRWLWEMHKAALAPTP